VQTEKTPGSWRVVDRADGRFEARCSCGWVSRAAATKAAVREEARAHWTAFHVPPEAK